MIYSHHQKDLDVTNSITQRKIINGDFSEPHISPKSKLAITMMKDERERKGGRERDKKTEWP